MKLRFVGRSSNDGMNRQKILKISATMICSVVDAETFTEFSNKLGLSHTLTRFYSLRQIMVSSTLTG